MYIYFDIDTLPPVVVTGQGTHTRSSTSTRSADTRDYSDISEVQKQALAIKAENETIAKLKEENKRLKEELANSKKKSKGFLSWLFS